MDEVRQRWHLFVMVLNCVCKIIESFHILGLIINGLRSNKLSNLITLWDYMLVNHCSYNFSDMALQTGRCIDATLLPVCNVGPPASPGIAYTVQIILISFHKNYFLHLESAIVRCGQRPRHLRSQRVAIDGIWMLCEYILI